MEGVAGVGGGHDETVMPSRRVSDVASFLFDFGRHSTASPRLQRYSALVTESSEPQLETEPRLLGILDELRAREPIAHRPELGTTRAAFAAQLDDDFWEIGASGRRYSREYVLAALEDRWSRPHEDVWEAGEFHCRAVGESTYALTYTLRQGERVTRRLTIWRNVEGVWRALFHQGTVVTE